MTALHAEVIDQEKKIKHSKLAEMVEEAITDPSKLNVKLKVTMRTFLQFTCMQLEALNQSADVPANNRK